MKRGDFLISTAALIGNTDVFSKISAVAQDTPVKGGTLIRGHSETVQNLDIQQAGTAPTSRLQNAHSSTVTVDANLNVISGLAQSFEKAPDGLTCTFKMRPAVAALRPAVPR